MEKLVLTQLRAFLQEQRHCCPSSMAHGHFHNTDTPLITVTTHILYVLVNGDPAALYPHAIHRILSTRTTNTRACVYSSLAWLMQLLVARQRYGITLETRLNLTG